MASDTKQRLSLKARQEWASYITIARDYTSKCLADTRKYSSGSKANAEHWRGVNWDYDAVTANYVYANLQSTLPRVLMRVPRVKVRPAARLTRAAMRAGETAQTSIDRFVAAALVQQVANWRVREFDFAKQVRRVVRDDHNRGIGSVRHGYFEEEYKERQEGGKTLEMEHHTHVRGGWPFAVHQPIDCTIWDSFARDLDERRWVGFLKAWRPDDAKARFKMRTKPEPNIVLGADTALDETARDDYRKRYLSTAGMTAIWEIWDRRTKTVLYWIDRTDEEICVEDWPIEFEGLPDTVLYTNESNERIEPLPDPGYYWELQQELNKLISLVLVYAKRGVPLIGMNSSQITEEEAARIEDAEILEIIKTKGDPAQALQRLDLSAVPQTLLLAVNMVQGLMKEISGIGSFRRGTRENVESALEAAEIAQGGDARAAMRAEAVREFFGRVVRKDWQTFVQTTGTTGAQVLDLIAEGLPPLLVRLEPNQMAMEFEFEIQVHSGEPANEMQEQRQMLALVQALQSDPELRAQLNIRAVAQRLVRSFGGDENELLAQRDAANAQVVVDAFGRHLGKDGLSAGAQRIPQLGAAVEALKARPDNKDVGRR